MWCMRGRQAGQSFTLPHLSEACFSCVKMGLVRAAGGFDKLYGGQSHLMLQCWSQIHRVWLWVVRLSFSVRKMEILRAALTRYVGTHNDSQDAGGRGKGLGTQRPPQLLA